MEEVSAPEIKWKFENVMTALVLMLTMAMQYGAFAVRMNQLEANNERQVRATEANTAAIHSLENTMVRVQTRQDERADDRQIQARR